MNYYLRYQISCKWALSRLLMVNFLSFSHFLPLSTKRFSQKMDGKCMTQLGSTEDRWVLCHILPQPPLFRSEGLCSNIIGAENDPADKCRTGLVRMLFSTLQCLMRCFRHSSIHWWTLAQVAELTLGSGRKNYCSGLVIRCCWQWGMEGVCFRYRHPIVEFHTSVLACISFNSFQVFLS